MSFSVEQSARVQQIGSSSTDGACVLYVMSRDQRVFDNHALLAAQSHALTKNLPLAVVFCLYPSTGFRAKEQYEFMLEGLREVESTLATFNIPFMMLIGPPQDRLQGMLHHLSPDAVYFDFNPLRGARALQQKIVQTVPGNYYVVDTHNIVPCKVASEKAEFGAYTIRPKIHAKFSEYLAEPGVPVVHSVAWPGVVQKLHDLKPIISPLVEKLPSNGTRSNVISGQKAAHDHLEAFINDTLVDYALDCNEPSLDKQSGLSPYLHFGHISALRVALRLQEVALQHHSNLHLLQSPKMPKPEQAERTIMQGIDALIEELVVRKELADNFCYYTDNYTSVAAAPKWAVTSLEAHAQDAREHSYCFAQLRDGLTHDAAWNAAQRQLTTTGKMHGYMRMYWAKKILEWSPDRVATQTSLLPSDSGVLHAHEADFVAAISQHSGASWAIMVTTYFNDFYSIDGGDPNGYAGIMWAIAGVHDRAWTERSIFGKIRYMNYGGLLRKFAIQTYEKKWL